MLVQRTLLIGCACFCTVIIFMRQKHFPTVILKQMPLFSVKRYIAILVNESPATSTLVMETVSKSINSNGRSYTRGRIIRRGG